MSACERRRAFGSMVALCEWKLSMEGEGLDAMRSRDGHRPWRSLDTHPHDNYLQGVPHGY